MENGLYTHGSGYEWEDVFKKAFETDENIGKIGFDCEASGFFCYAEDLSLLEEFGRRFRALCMDTKNFESLVCSALQEAAVRRAEAEELSGTIPGISYGVSRMHSRYPNSGRTASADSGDGRPAAGRKPGFG